MAALELKILTELYPLAELYDKSEKMLADIFFRKGEYLESLRHLEAMVLLDPLYSREDIDYYRCTMYEKWYYEDASKLTEVIDAYQNQVRAYVNSDKYSLYIYRLAFYQITAGEYQKARDTLTAVERPTGDPILDDQINALIEMIADSD